MCPALRFHNPPRVTALRDGGKRRFRDNMANSNDLYIYDNIYDWYHRFVASAPFGNLM
jgi:hypothetical protein